jgi:hypothetical protein
LRLLLGGNAQVCFGTNTQRRRELSVPQEVYKEAIEKVRAANEGAGESWLEQYGKILEWNRQWVYVNSWHMNEYESAAMWRLYARTNEAIAVQSSYARLCECLPSKVHLASDNVAEVYTGEVQYIDYETDWLPEGNLFYPIVHKRKSFEHEREMRAVIQDATPGGNMAMENLRTGCLVGVSLEELVEAVYVAPTAPAWFRDLVGAITHKYGFIHKPIIRSSLDVDPVF